MLKTIYIEGMSCEHCVKRVKNALAGMVGIKNVEVLLDDKKAIVEMETDVEDLALQLAIEEAGYEVAAIEE